MTTKEQERKALEKIKKIVAELGQDSYVGTAFDGCFELAESNIENDFADSAKYYIDKCRNADVVERDAYSKALADAEYFRRQASDLADILDNAENEKNKVQHNLFDCRKKLDEALDKIEDRDAIIEQRDLEIMKLKAKLYDLMVK